MTESVHELFDLVRASGICHGVLERMELVRRFRDFTRSGHGLLENRTTMHLPDVLAEIPDDHPAIDQHLAAVRLLLTDDHTKHGGLPRAIGPDETDLFPPKGAHRRLQKENLAPVLLRNRIDANQGALNPYAPITGERLPEVVAGRISDDDLGPCVSANEHGVLAKDAAEGHSLFAIHTVHEPRRLAPRALGIFFVT